MGASYGDARTAADAVGICTTRWNPVESRVEPQVHTREVYDDLYGAYRRAYLALRDDMHLLSSYSTH